MKLTPQAYLLLRQVTIAARMRHLDAVRTGDAAGASLYAKLWIKLEHLPVEVDGLSPVETFSDF